MGVRETTKCLCSRWVTECIRLSQNIFTVLQDKLEKTSSSDSSPLNKTLIPLWGMMPCVFLTVAAVSLFICRGKKAWADGRREPTEVKSGSIMSVGRLISDILQRPVSEEARTNEVMKQYQISSCMKGKQVEATCRTHPSILCLRLIPG